MKKYYKAYAYLLNLIRVVVISFSIMILIIMILNINSIDTSGLSAWVSIHVIWLLVFTLIVVCAYWSYLMPTLRLIFNLKDSSVANGRSHLSNKQMILCFVSILLVLFASYGSDSAINQLYVHPARYGYVGNFLFILFLFSVIASLSRPSRYAFNEIGFAHDNALTQVGPTDTQKQAYKDLKLVLESGMPRSVALTGEWGSGKTYVYNLVKAKISDDNKKIIWVEFDPWRYASEEALIKSFYETIAREIDNRIPGLQGTLKKVTRSVAGLVDKNGHAGYISSLVNDLTNSLTQGDSPDQLIRSILENEGRRLIIVMDDIERSYDQEKIYRALQLVHHSRSMGDKNVQILCLYEKNALINAAPEYLLSREEYLEKFSEIEISITPPESVALRTQFEDLLSTIKYTYLPNDFRLNLSDALLKDIKSHRGIIRAFNELVIEFRRTSNRQYKLADEGSALDFSVATVSYDDRFILNHIKLKYPVIFKDIATNRARYTSSSSYEEDIRLMFMDEKEIVKDQEKHFNSLFNNAAIEGERAEGIKALLCELFPVLKQVFQQGIGSSAYEDFRKLRRVGSREVLDAYFANTKSQDAYIQHELWINALLDNIEKLNDDEMFKRFETYMARANNDDSDIDSITLLREELLNGRHTKYNLRAFCVWLRVALSNGKLLFGDENAILGRIISAINMIIEKEKDADIRVELGQGVFQGITRYYRDPRGPLLLLLYIHPGRDNNYLLDYVKTVAFNRNSLYEKTLKWVDKYYESKGINIYQDEYAVYSFILYQWALSSPADASVINQKVRGAPIRYKRVNDYIFGLLSRDDRLAYDVILKRFWVDDPVNPVTERGWSVNSSTIAPYDPLRLERLAEQLVKSRFLVAEDRSKATEFRNVIKEYNTIATPSDSG